MPFINVYTSAPAPSSERATALLRTLSQTLARELKKPESYVMTCLMPETRMTFGGSSEPACYAEVKNIGALSSDTTSRLSSLLCGIFERELGVPKKRVYIEFACPEPHLFGHDGETFA